MLLDCAQIQLGDQAVYRRSNSSSPSITVMPTVVFRVHVFKDIWTTAGDWRQIVSKPVNTLVDHFPMLRLCKDSQCTGCDLCHTSIEEDGIEVALPDVWGFNWRKVDGAKAQPNVAEVLSVYIRVPES